MSKTRKIDDMKIKNTNSKSIFLSIIAIIILFVGFSILQPKVSSRLLVQKRQILWSNFYTNLKSTKNIDSKNFWEFREFYSPGSFLFERDGLSREEVLKVLKGMKISSTHTENDLHFLAYRSDYISSIEVLTKEKSIDSFIKDYYLISEGDLLLRGKNYILLKQNPKKVLLIFLLPESEMKKANGFFDYQEKDKELVRGKYWLDITLIALD